jgi:hypothetical protein
MVPPATVRDGPQRGSGRVIGNTERAVKTWPRPVGWDAPHGREVRRYRQTPNVRGAATSCQMDRIARFQSRCHAWPTAGAAQAEGSD